MPGLPGIAPTTEQPEGRRLALVVATTAYTGSLRALRAPARDAADLSEMLADPQVGGFEVTSVIDGTAHQLRLAVEDFLAERRSDDLVLVYLSCHGLVDARRRLYFAATDTDKSRLAATGVESQWLLDQMEDTRARRQVLILDCCFSGAFAQRAKAGDTDLGLGERFYGQGRGRVVLTASRATEYSFEGEPVPGAAMPGSVFTNGLVEGIRSGAADIDGDGYISVDDAYAYAYERVRATDAQQTPQRWLYGAEGSILLARSASAGPSQPGRSGPERPSAGAVHVIPRGAAGSERASARGFGTWARPSRRAAVIGAIALLLVVAIVGAVLLQGHGSPSAKRGNASGAGGSTSVGTGVTGQFSEQAPWRLVLADNFSGADPGCTVTVTNADTGESVAAVTKNFNAIAIQVHESGTFRWQASAADCSVGHHSGAGRVTLPFTAPIASGDTNAFAVRPGSRVAVKVTDASVGQVCEIRLWDAQTGDEQDFQRSSIGSGPVYLDVHDSSLVYLHDVECQLHVTPS